MAEQERHHIILWPQFTPSWTEYQYMFSAHKNDYAWWNILSCGNMPMCCTVRCIFYRRVYVEKWFWYRNCTVTIFVCVIKCEFQQSKSRIGWTERVLKTLIIIIISARCSKIIKSALSVTPLRSALIVPDILFSIRSGTKPELADLFGYQMW